MIPISRLLFHFIVGDKYGRQRDPDEKSPMRTRASGIKNFPGFIADIIPPAD
jgi:hypothetical protein